MPNDPENDVTQTPAIPVVDLGKFLTGNANVQSAIAADVDNICKRIGFLIIENHGVPKNVIDDAWLSARDFFDLPMQEKLESKAADPGCPRGYFPFAAEALAKSLGNTTPPDIKESLGFGPMQAPETPMSPADFEFHYGSNLWPDNPKKLRQNLTTYFSEMEALGSRVLQLFAAALDLEHDYFARFHRYPMCALRCINYPALDVPPLPDQKGAGEHSDYGSITLLKSDPDVPGLEVRLPSGNWATAPLVRNAFIVNIGDMMARWTNDRWVSTLHRVVNPTVTNGTVRRQSMAFFHNTSFDAQIDCIPTCCDVTRPAMYATTSAGKYLADRFRAAVN